MHYKSSHVSVFCLRGLTDSSSASLMLVNAFRIEDSGLDTPIVPISLRIASPSCLTVYFSQFASTSDSNREQWSGVKPVEFRVNPQGTYICMGGDTK